MSRIGRTPISIPTDVTVEISTGQVIVKGPKGELIVPMSFGVKVEEKDQQLLVGRTSNEKQARANHGLMRSLLNNAIEGVTNGYKITLKMEGTGYRVQARGKDLNLQVGFSHDVIYESSEGVELSVEGNDTIYITGIDKQKVGQTAAEIRKIKPPEPYKGKGIRYEDEVVKRKQGKAAVA